MRWLAAIALVLSLCMAQDYLLASAEEVAVSGAVRGHGQSLNWIHAADDNTVVVVGAARFGIADTRWTLGRFEISQAASERWRWNGIVEVGPADSAGESFTYRKLGGGLEYRLGPAVTVAVKDTYVDIRPSAGHLLAAEATWRRTPRLFLQAAVHESFGARLDASALSARIDYFGRRHWFAGAVSGRTSDPRLLNLGSAIGAGTYRQWYAGVNIPVGAATLSLSADFIDAGMATRRGLTVAVKLPLGKRQGTGQ